MEEKLLALLDKYGLREPAISRWQVLIQSFSADSLKTVHAMDPRLPLIFLGNPSRRQHPVVRRLRRRPRAELRREHQRQLGQHRARQLPRRAPVHDQHRGEHERGARRRRRRHVHELRRRPDRDPRRRARPTGLQGAMDAKLSHDACLARNAKGGVGGTRAGDALADPRRSRRLRRVHARAWPKDLHGRPRRPTSSPRPAGDADARRPERDRDGQARSTAVRAAAEPLVVDAISTAGTSPAPASRSAARPLRRRC